MRAKKEKKKKQKNNEKIETKSRPLAKQKRNKANG